MVQPARPSGEPRSELRAPLGCDEPTWRRHGMSGSGLFFNVDPGDGRTPDAQDQYLFASDPAVRLQEVTGPTPRNTRQRQLLDGNRGKLSLSAAVSDWAYRKYSVQ